MDTRLPNDDLKVSVHSRQILSIALPITLAILVPQLNLLFNSIFLGHYSSEALGNAGITGVFYLIFAVAGHGLNSAMQSVFSGHAGAGEHDRFKIVMSQGIRIGLSLALVFIAFTWMLGPSILSAVSSKESYPMEISFLKIRIWGLPFLYLFQIGNAFLISSLNSRLLLIGFAIEALMNILLDYTLIFGHFGCPRLGFNGAAWASVIAECTGMIVVFTVIRAAGLKKKFSLLESFRYEKESFYKVLKMATPLIFQYIISLTTWLIFFLLIESHGSNAKAISNTMRSVFGLGGIFIWAFSGAANNMVSNLIGQNKEGMVLHAIKKITVLSFTACMGIVVLLNIFPAEFFNLFGQNSTFTQEGTAVIRVVSIGMISMSIANIWLNGLTGVGRTLVNLSIEIIAIISYLIYTFYFMKYNYISLAWAWSNEIVYWSVIGVFSFLYFYSGKWKKQRE